MACRIGVLINIVSSEIDRRDYHCFSVINAAEYVIFKYVRKPFQNWEEDDKPTVEAHQAHCCEPNSAATTVLINFEMKDKLETGR